MRSGRQEAGTTLMHSSGRLRDAGRLRGAVSQRRPSRAWLWLRAGSWQHRWEGLSDDPPNWLFAEPTGWIVGPALSLSRTRSEHTGGRLAVAGGRDQGFN
jgi:hypothetical protein